MAVDYLPATWLTGYSSDATHMKLTWASLTPLVNGEDDIRDILRKISELIEAKYDALVDAAVPTTVPTKFTASTSTRYNDSTSEFEEKHGLLFDLTVDSTSLASETQIVAVNKDMVTAISILHELEGKVSALEGKMSDLYMRPRMPYTQDAFVGDKLRLDADLIPEWTTQQMPESEAKFSKFSVTSFGGGKGLESVTIEEIELRIQILIQVITDLEGKMAELSMRPRMAYTQEHDAGQILILVDDGNDEPDWDDDMLPTVTTTSNTSPVQTTSYTTPGTRKIKNKTTMKHQIKQPWISISSDGDTVASGTDTSTTTPTAGNPTTTTQTTYAVGRIRAGKIYHFEATVSGLGWVETGTYMETNWPGDFEPGTDDVEFTTYDTPSTLPTTTRTTTGTTTTTTTSP